MQELDILIEDPRWEEAGLAALAEDCVRAVLTRAGIDPAQATLSVLACDDARIALLNADFRGKPAATNVLSWPAEERGAGEGRRPEPPQADVFGTIELGDVAISYDTCAAEARAAGKPFEHHVRHLLVHGVLHLLGYDHISDGDAALMERTEAEILGKMGIDDPYNAN
jgi:probable rRNA maturation factor